MRETPRTEAAKRMSGGVQENEIKLAVENERSARNLLRRADFRVSRPRIFEVNIVFDTGELALRKSSRLLRLRTAGKLATVTYKGPPLVSRHKQREEVEFTVSDPSTAMVLFERLGFQKVFRYEKYRTEFKAGKKSGVAVLDQTPIGVYLELEGSEDWIDRTAQNLGFRESDYITESYGRLYLQWCEEQGRTPGDMVFQ